MFRFRESDTLFERGLFVAGLFAALVVLVFPGQTPSQQPGNKAEQETDVRPKADPPGDARSSATVNRPRSDPEERSAVRAGWATKIPLPITSQTYKRVRRFVLGAKDKASEAGQRPVLIFEFQVLPHQNEFGRGTEFGAAYELADFLSGEKLSEATTVAYVPQSIQGHAVLVALACDEIIMAKDAQIGPAGVDEEVITDTILLTYEEIANRRKKIPAAVARALVDPNREVLRVETEISTEYVSPEELEQLRERRTIQGTPKALFRKGQPGQLSGAEARQHGFVNYLAGNLRDVARAMDLRPEAIQEDPSLSAERRAVRIDLKGPINAQTVDEVQRLIEDAVRRDVNFVCLWIDSPGGSPVDSLRLATFLACDLDPSEVRTVAYVPSQALSDAALVALACDEVVMHPRAVLGGEGDGVYDDAEIERVCQTIRTRIAPGKSRSWSLPAAMIDPDLEVFRCTRLGDRKYEEYFSQAELDEQPDPEQWEKGQAVTVAEEPLEVSGAEAEKYWLADHLAENFTGLKKIYGLEDDPALLEPGWIDFLVEALAAGPLAFLLLMIGFAALYVELQAPGIGIGGFTAAVCFALFFWSRFLGGTSGWLEVTLFVAGVSFLLLEVFVIPGFGIFGLGGGLLVIASLILASQTFVLPQNTYQLARLQSSLLVLVAAGVGTLVAISLINRWLPELPSPEEAEAAGQHDALVEYDHLVGVRGTTSTQLAPSGKARFGDQLVDVIADCEAIGRGAEIEVVEVHGNRVFVRPVDEVA